MKLELSVVVAIIALVVTYTFGILTLLIGILNFVLK